MGTGLDDVWERKDAKDWTAIEVRAEALERGGEGAPSVGNAWILCIFWLLLRDRHGSAQNGGPRGWW
jgi:hypothetical protein